MRRQLRVPAPRRLARRAACHPIRSALSPARSPAQQNGGHYVISVKANCIDSTVPAEAVFAKERTKLLEEGLKPNEQLTLEPYERDHCCIVGTYRGAPTKK